MKWMRSSPSAPYHRPRPPRRKHGRWPKRVSGWRIQNPPLVRGGSKPARRRPPSIGRPLPRLRGRGRIRPRICFLVWALGDAKLMYAVDRARLRRLRNEIGKQCMGNVSGASVAHMRRAVAWTLFLQPRDGLGRSSMPPRTRVGCAMSVLADDSHSETCAQETATRGHYAMVQAMVSELRFADPAVTTDPRGLAATQARLTRFWPRMQRGLGRLTFASCRHVMPPRWLTCGETRHCGVWTARPRGASWRIGPTRCVWLCRAGPPWLPSLGLRARPRRRGGTAQRAGRRWDEGADVDCGEEDGTGRLVRPYGGGASRHVALHVFPRSGATARARPRRACALPSATVATTPTLILDPTYTLAPLGPPAIKRHRAHRRCGHTRRTLDRTPRTLGLAVPPLRAPCLDDDLRHHGPWESQAETQHESHVRPRGEARRQH